VCDRSVASRNLPFKTDHDRNIDFSLPDVVTIDLNTSFDSRHPLEKNLRQSPQFEGPEMLAQHQKAPVSID
jgi:hypothetical protein